MPKAQRRRILKSISFKRYTDKTITDIETIAAQLENIAVTRVGWNNEELQAGVIGIAVPVTNSSGRMIASVALQAPVARLPLARAHDFVPNLQRAAAAMAITFEVGDGGKA
jgi:DNA-binding IclR family transcriptional regulator